MLRRLILITSLALIATLPAAAVDPVQILWDTSNGVLDLYEPSGYYSELTAMLAGDGFVMTASAAGVDNLDLAGFDVLVVCIGSAWWYAYEPAEVDAIAAFMAGGGGVLVLSDQFGARNHHVDPVAGIIGAACGVSAIDPDDLTVTDLAAHPLFDGIGSIFLRKAGALAAAAASEEVAHTDEGKAVVVASEDGTMVIVGDANFCTNEHIEAADNAAFARNIFQFLAEAGPVSVAAETWSAVRELFR